MEPTFTVTTKLWKYKSEKTSWFFLTVPKELSDQIKGFQEKRIGFGSVRVEATIGNSTWKTSIFPSKEGVYYLPVKKDIRNAENVLEDSTATVTLKLI